jgi:hypothetical protein
LGGDICCLEHVSLVYVKFQLDEHGMYKEDYTRKDMQNWALAQRLCQKKTRDCLKRLHFLDDVHQERALGIEMYLQICSNYIDIFLSEKLDLRSRVVLASKVLFFFRIWKLWLKHGHHRVLGNNKSCHDADSFVSQQCFVDV